MSAITKTLSSELASILLKTKKEQLKKLELKLEEAVISLITERTPKEVLNIFKTNKEYINTSNYFTFEGFGFNYKRIYTSKNIPCTNHCFQLTKKESEFLKPFSESYDNLKSEINQTKEELEAVLFKLRTYKRVIEEFPELEKELPNKSVSTLVNLSDLKARLK